MEQSSSGAVKSAKKLPRPFAMTTLKTVIRAPRCEPNRRSNASCPRSITSSLRISRYRSVTTANGSPPIPASTGTTARYRFARRGGLPTCTSARVTGKQALWSASSQVLVFRSRHPRSPVRQLPANAVPGEQSYDGILRRSGRRTTGAVLRSGRHRSACSTAAWMGVRTVTPASPGRRGTPSPGRRRSPVPGRVRGCRRRRADAARYRRPPPDRRHLRRVRSVPAEE